MTEPLSDGDLARLRHELIAASGSTDPEDYDGTHDRLLYRSLPALLARLDRAEKALDAAVRWIDHPEIKRALELQARTNYGRIDWNVAVECATLASKAKAYRRALSPLPAPEREDRA